MCSRCVEYALNRLLEALLTLLLRSRFHPQVSFANDFYDIVSDLLVTRGYHSRFHDVNRFAWNQKKREISWSMEWSVSKSETAEPSNETHAVHEFLNHNKKSLRYNWWCICLYTWFLEHVITFQLGLKYHEFLIFYYF